MPSILDFTRSHLLRGEDGHAAAIREVDTLLDRDPAPGTEEYERLEFLSVLMEEYEDEHEPEDTWKDLPRASSIPCWSRPDSPAQTSTR